MNNPSEIVEEKVPFLMEIAYFALDVSFKIYSKIHGQDSERILEISKKVVVQSQFSKSGSVIKQSIQALSQSDREFIINWINKSYFAESPLTRSWLIFLNATGRDWLRQYGFESQEEFVELLGAKLYKELDDLAREMGRQFVLIDEFSMQLEEKPLNEWDLLIAGNYDMQRGGWDITNHASEYCLAQTLQHELKEIPFTDREIEIISEKIDERVHSIHPNNPKVDLRDLLR